jgi:hypothetical protein
MTIMLRNNYWPTPTLGLIVFASGCAKQPASEAPRSSPSEQAIVSEWLPLENNSVLDFETAVEGTQEKGRLVMQVRRPHGNTVELDVAGKVRRLEVKPEGIAIATGGWLLKQPFTVGATFQGLNGVVTVVSTDRTVDVPAGHFTNCVETEEKTATTVTRTDYCRGTGITRLVIEGDVNGELRREVANLRFHGPRIDLGPEKTTAAPAGQ